MKDPYEILGVAPSASDEDIKKAYRKLALEWHPDRHQGNAEAEERFKEINAAFQAVGTAEARSRQQGSWRAQPNIDMEDLMSQMGFGRFGFNPFKRQRSRGTPKIHLPITLEEAHAGCSKRVTVRQTAPCDSCRGRGRTGDDACGVCNGSGQADVQVAPVIRMVVPCSACNGSGLGGPTCSACNGSGQTVRDRTINVEVPKGAESNLMLPSDGVLVVIQHKPHETYKKLTRTDIMSTVCVDALDAMLGTQVSVRTLAGEMKMKVPAGTQPGARLRIANAGLNSRDGRKGDHIVLVEISIPQLTIEQQRVIRKMRAAPARERNDGYEDE